MRNTTRRLLLLVFLNLTIGFAMAQPQKSYSGVVKDTAGVGIPGISVQVKGTKTLTQTDANGAFKISTAQANPTLVFTGVGFSRVEMAAGEGLDVKLLASSSELNEVVVTALGISQNAKKIGYTVQKVGAKDIIKAKNTRNFFIFLFLQM